MNLDIADVDIKQCWFLKGQAWDPTILLFSIYTKEQKSGFKQVFVL